jgi:hypothetical protein
MSTDNPSPTVQSTALLLALNAANPVERIMLLALSDHIDARRQSSDREDIKRRERMCAIESSAERSERRWSDRRSILLGFVAPAVASVVNRVVASVMPQPAAVN